MSEIEPPLKKTKLCLDNTNIINTIDKYIQEINHSKKNLTAVLDYDIGQPIELTNVYVGYIKNVKDIAKTIQILSVKLQLKSLEHLKRAMRHKIILCPITAFDATVMSIENYIKSIVPELANVFDNFEEVEVPLKPPKTDTECQLAKKYWSCNFHPNKYFERLVGDDFFTTDELYFHRLYIEVGFEAARWYVIENKVILNTDDVFRSINTTIVVDPKLNSIVAISFDNRQAHPIQHSAMLAIDSVAKTQNGGAWISKEDKLTEYLKKKFQTLKFFSNIQSGVGEREKKDIPYLCTNYYVYMLREPCVMCGMALVHARAQRIFFCVDNIENGSLKSKAKLQTIESLNHRFEVFTGFV